MPARVRPRRDFQQLEHRRKQAGRLFAAGKMILAAIARQLKVSRQSVSRWYTEWNSGGVRALNGAGRAGRKPRLDPRQLRKVERTLRQGARANGFDTDLWTLPRVALVIERATHVHYHPGHVWKDPGSDGLDTAATRLDERTVAGSKTNTRRQKAWIFFQDESRVSQHPCIRGTWAPEGETPVLIHAFNWSKMSICAAIGYRWDGRRSRLFFQTREGSYNTESLIAFLDNFKRHVRRRKAILVWDGLPAHKSRAMQEYLLRQRGWLTVERLPGYAPGLNPIETMWGNIKGK